MTAQVEQPAGAAHRRAEARHPVAPAGASYVGALLAIAVAALGVVAIRDAAVALGWLRGGPWTSGLIDAVDGTAPAPWMTPVAAVAAVLGLVCVVIAVKPRKKIARHLIAQSGVHLDHASVARLAVNAARTVSGVLDARAHASRFTVTVTATVTSTSRSPADAITRAVEEALAVLADKPRVRVRTKLGGPA